MTTNAKLPVDSRSFADWVMDPRLLTDLSSQLGILSGSLGFDLFTFVYIDGANNSRQRVVNNHPKQDWINDDIKMRDPVVGFVKSHEGTLIWTPSFYHESGNSDIWEQGNADGISAGVLTCTKPQPNQTIILSLSRADAGSNIEEELTTVSDHIPLVTKSLTAAFLSLYATQDDLGAKLTREELEYLRYAFHNWSDFDIADKVKRPSYYVGRILKQAQGKIGASSRFEAAVCAARCGLLGLL